MTTASVLQIADNVILAGGVLLILLGLVVVSERRKWNNLLNLPATPSHRLEAADLLLALFSFFFLPVLFFQLFSSMGSTPAHTLAATVSLIAASVILLRIGLARFDGGAAGWGLTTSRLPLRLGQALTGYLFVVPLCFALLTASTWFLDIIGWPANKHASILAISDPTTPIWIRCLTIFNALVLSAVAEELFFRGILQPALSRALHNSWAAILLCGILFGAIHFPYNDTMLPLAMFSIVLGYLYAKTGSLTLTVLLHALFNGKTLLWLVLGAPP